MTDNPDLESIERTLKEIPFPTRLAVELCADCNLTCSMCHHDKMLRPKGVMPLQLWKKCADEVVAVAPRTEVWFSFCGEPLLQPELLLQMLDYGRDAGLKSQSINTNGVYLAPQLHERILDTSAQRVVIGIDGFSADVYENIRIGAKRDETYNNVELLLEARARRDVGPEIMVQFIEMDGNKHEANDFRAYWLERGATVKMRNQLSWGGKFDASLGSSFDDRIPCPWAMTMMHVFWDGRIPRCPGDTEGDEGVGNVWHDTLSDLWQRLGAFRGLHMAHEFNALPERCHTCTDWMVGIAQRIRPATEHGGPSAA